MKLFVASNVLQFGAQFRDTSPEHHVFGWLLGQQREGNEVYVVGYAEAVHVAQAVSVLEARQTSVADTVRERSELRRVLPHNIDVVGFYASLRTEDNKDNKDNNKDNDNNNNKDNSASLCSQLHSAVSERWGAALSVSAWIDAQAASLGKLSVTWRHSDGRQLQGAALVCDATVVKRFSASAVPVLVSGLTQPLTDDAVLRVGGSGRMMSYGQLRKSAVGDLFPSAPAAEVENVGGFDYSRVLHVLRRVQVNAEDSKCLELVAVDPAALQQQKKRDDGVDGEWCVGYFSPKSSLSSIIDALQSSSNSARGSVFHLPCRALSFAICVPRDADLDSLYRRFNLSPHLKYFGAASTVQQVWNSASLLKQPRRLINVHDEIADKHGLKDATVTMIEGFYEYCHYMQDAFDDDGWGCAYRSLQTICSWLRMQGVTSEKAGISEGVPSHSAMQQALFQLHDKPKEFIGSKQWIGSVELSMILNYWYGIDCRLLNVASGSDVPQKLKELQVRNEDQRVERESFCIFFFLIGPL